MRLLRAPFLPEPCLWRRSTAWRGGGEAEEAAAAAATVVVAVWAAEAAAASGTPGPWAAGGLPGGWLLSPRPGSEVVRPAAPAWLAWAALVEPWRRGPLLWMCDTASAACMLGGAKRESTRSNAWALCSCVSSSL